MYKKPKAVLSMGVGATKKDRALPFLCTMKVLSDLWLCMTTSGSVTHSPTGKSCGRSSVGPALLAIYFP